MADRLVRAVVPALGFGSAYAIAILAGRATRVPGSEVSLVWPAAAVAVLWGTYAVVRPRAVALLHGSLLAALTFVVNLATGATAGLSAWFVGVNLTLAGVTAVVLRADGRPAVLRDPSDLTRLVVAVTVGTVGSALLAVAYFAWVGNAGLVSTFTLFAVRNGVTALAGVAVALRLREVSWARPEPGPPRLLLEGGLTVAAVGAVFVGVFWVNSDLPLAFVTMLPAMWVALRCSTTASTLFVAASGTAVVGATLLDHGVFSGLVPWERALLSQALVGSLTLVVLALALYRDSRGRLIDELRHLAHHDALTGLADRTLLTQRLESALERPEPGCRVGVVFVDLDGFKLVNDAWGHQEGDLLLVEIARRLREVAGPDDLVARIGGDEFVIACPRAADEAAVHALAERVRVCVARPYGTASDAPYDRITASVGVAVAGLSASARSLIVEADHMMYDAKRAGRAGRAGDRSPAVAESA